MPELDFRIESVAVVPFAAAPLLSFGLRVTNSMPGEIVHHVILRCQIQIESGRRSYSPDEQARLRDLFGEPDRWGRTVRPMLWTHATVTVPELVTETTVDVPVPCSWDFNVAATKYFHGVLEGDLPLAFLFSGSVFYETAGRPLQVAPIPWDREARFRLPVATWRTLMDEYYPNAAWLQVRWDVFDRLQRYREREGLGSWEQTIERLLPAGEAEVVKA